MKKTIGLLLIAVIGLTVWVLIIRKPNLTGLYQQKADNALFLSGDYKTAIRYYDSLIHLHRDWAGLYYNRGDAYDYDGQYEKAIADYKKSLELGITDSAQAILRIALTAKRLGDFLTEEERLLQLLAFSKGKKENKNEFWASNYHLGQLEFKKKNYRKAIDYYNVAHLTSPTNLELYHRANAYFALGLLDSARQDFNTSIAFVKKDYVRKYPNSDIAQCDTCGFPFGSEEYLLLTERDVETTIQVLDKYSDDNKELKELNDKLKEAEKNNR